MKMVIHKTIKDFFKRKNTIRNKNLIIKIGNEVFSIKKPTEKEYEEHLSNNLSLCEYFCDFSKECLKYSIDDCKLHRNFFFRKLSDIEALILTNKK